MLYRIMRSFLFKMNPEKAHDLSIKQLKLTHGTVLDLFYRQRVQQRPVTVMGLTFPNSVGLAAGLDKNAECIDAFGAMGFGHVEVGTVTPVGQPGNPSPRLFRVLEGEGIINRMGFNNDGVDNLIENVKNSEFKGVIGINIGKNIHTPVEQGKEDYLICMEKVYPHAGYIAVNISSPNTPGLRSLQYGEALDDLLMSLKERQQALAKKHEKYVPIALKVAPDLNDEEIESIAQSLLKYKIDGLIATNTTLDREMIKGMSHAAEAGGLSGRPVQHKSTEVIAKFAAHLKGEIPIIGVGGIDSVMAAKEKINAGASLVQVYSGFIYQGPGLIKNIVNHI
ncbi:quinone-dependent dihydroorotate dehydrogenase [Psychromonas sp. 14N.309.X.WAT.B.A12]|uniref:quinone-dependent dihydroorotate dehydrogenase n=1 Tax=unclassified Psychromonas TaxID=2614957 RepID=UPI0025B0F67C|nr:quinone-dependent dihydroorotate dehydrogenase [Psychromonas sp. 14N.309.X.WAT.B.A12]MDN2662202.1 quinone-dependent dihydroorotate dehydrogenase [Psychromonas sp. 14N.309.X.WAT.B.A12]